MQKFARVVKARWWLVAALAIAGLMAAALYAELRNRDVEPVFEAVGVVTFESTATGRNQEETAGVVTDALTIAQAANEEVLAAGQGRIAADERAGTLTFTSRARTGEEAEATASEMRRAYVSAVVAGTGSDVEARRRAIITEATQILEELNELEPAEAPPVTTAPPVDPVQQGQLDQLNAQVSTFTQQRSKLAVDLILAESGNEEVGSVEDIQAEIDLVTQQLDQLYADIAVLTEELGGETGRTTTTTQSEDRGSQNEVPSVENPAELEPAWTRAALEARYAELGTEFESLFTQSGDDSVTPTESTIEVADLTMSITSVPLSVGVGLLAGVALALGLAFAEAKVRGAVWVPSDVPAATLTEVPAFGHISRVRRRRRIPVWKRRKIGVHELRNLVVGMLDRTSDVPVIGFTGAGVDHDEVDDLALWLAKSMAAADRSVVFMNLDFQAGVVPDTGVPTVADLVAVARREPEEGLARMKQALNEASDKGINPRIIQAGRPSGEASDLILTTAFGRLMQAAREDAEVVVVVMPPTADPLTATIRQRVDWLVAVCAVGRSKSRAVETLAAAAGPGAAQLAGVVLVKGWRAPKRAARTSRTGWSGRRLASNGRRKTATEESEETVEV